MDFSASKVGDSIWPEIGGVALLLATKMGARYFKEANALTKWKNPEYYVDAAAVGVPLYMIGTGKAVEESKAVLWAETGMLGQRAAIYAYDRTIGKGAKRAGRTRLGNPGGGTALQQAERAKAIAQANANARALALQLTSKTPASSRSGVTEF